MNEFLKDFSAVVVGLTALGQLGKKIFEYQEQFYVRRKLNRYSYLLKCCDKDSKESRFINMIKRDENLKIATGINTNYEKYQTIMQIYSLNMFTIAQIKKVHYYTDVVGGKTIGKYGLAEIISVAWSVFIALILTYYFIVITYLTNTNNDTSSIWKFLILTVTYLFLMFVVCEPIRATVLYFRFKKVLIANGMWGEVKQ
ncbi:hypothetical protein [Geobacter anodireducens]|uniref:Uncharacterized protein n=1 Tax=Geobacter anodireducens TaxID=1340425 RepID=A0ABR9NZH9_9BACT|nr:hypothetical protein [Geobacter anodireducens]MBE2889666.1 hypothetical protein [Geobacter anodireducens]